MSICDVSEVAQCDCCVLNLIKSALTQEVSNELGYSQIQHFLTLFRDVLNQKAIISLTLDRHIKFITPLAEQLLDQYFGCRESKILPVCLDHWLKQQILQCSSIKDTLHSSIPLHLEQSERQLFIYWIFDSKKGRISLLLEERESLAFSITILKSLGLTQREAEVLFWVARDKSNVEIAKVLNCCEGTVRKHLEHLYKKLDVQTRMGAVMTALEKLGLLQI
ncbi:MAG: helix-turn-helix transcriptional regulator [Spirulina sp.]